MSDERDGIDAEETPNLDHLSPAARAMVERLSFTREQWAESEAAVREAERRKARELFGDQPVFPIPDIESDACDWRGEPSGVHHPGRGMGELREMAGRAETVRQRYRALNEVQGTVPWGIRDYAMGFVGDVGDLQKLIMAKENVRRIDDADGKLAHELADCLWSLLVIANHYDIDLADAFDRTMDELTQHIAAEHADTA